MRILSGATTALRRIVDVGLVVLIIVVLFGVALGKVVPLTGRQSIIIGGGSMEPTIGLGATVIIVPVEPAALAVGDVVSLQVGPERTTFTHRVIAVVDRSDGRWIQTQGDANPTPDPTLVPVSAILGRVVLVIPLAGYVLALLSLPVGVMFVLGLAATLLAIAWLLESIEPEPNVRRPVLAEPARSDGRTLDPGALRGEPISARLGALPPPRPAGPASPRLELEGGATGSAGGVTLNSGFVSSASLPRPTVRVQLERARETRQRRARWQVARSHDQTAAD